MLHVVIDNDIKEEDIEKVDMRISDLAKGQGMTYEPASPLAARLSIPFCLATAALKRRVGLPDFSEEQLHNPKLREVMGKITIQAEPEFSAKYPRGFVSHLKLKTKSGKEYEDFIIYPKGHPDRPVEDKEIRDKYLSLASYTWPVAKAEKVFKIVMDLDKAETVNELTANLAGADMSSAAAGRSGV